jgi:hypothetical protein
VALSGNRAKNCREPENHGAAMVIRDARRLVVRRMARLTEPSGPAR